MSEPTTTTHTPALHARALRKTFPGVVALADVGLRVRRGERHALLGENGAGKSTLLKILGGIHPPDEGTLALDGREVRLASPRDARAAGITVVHQELSLVPDLSVAENIFLGAEPGRFGLPAFAEMRERAAEYTRRLGLRVAPSTPVHSLSVAEQQLVEIARALRARSRVLCLDEPTAALSPREAERLFALVRELSADGVAVLYVSHRLSEVFALCERATVLREGHTVAELDLVGPSATTEAALVRAMVGREVKELYPVTHRPDGAPRLEVRGLSRGERLKGVDLTVRAGEIVGVGGLVGAGRTELLRCIFGADLPDAGEVRVDGEPITPGNPAAATRAGIGLLTEDRKASGLLLERPIRENGVLATLPRYSGFGVVRPAPERRAVLEALERVRIRMASTEQEAQTLSGGNQQKVLLARWMLKGCRVLLFDEPTRGIDVGARAEIYGLIHALAAEGLAVLVVSSELPELAGLCDRVLVMAEGRITGELPKASATQEAILTLATPRGAVHV